MEQNKKLKLFISYSHQDNLDEQPYIEQFKTHIALLKDHGLIEEWYDREILAGKDYQKEIDKLRWTPLSRHEFAIFKIQLGLLF